MLPRLVPLDVTKLLLVVSCVLEVCVGCRVRVWGGGGLWLCVRVRVVLRERMTSEAREQARRAERGAMQENRAGEKEGME